MNAEHYVGNELSLFQHARRWKAYWSSKVIPFLGKEVMEVGAGIGGTTHVLLAQAPDVQRWVCLEPDGNLAAEIPTNLPPEWLASGRVVVAVQTLAHYAPAETFDSLSYIDVIEHIEDDAAELQRAADRLRPGGHLLVLVPAHNYLYSPFDKAIGHYRRYNKKMMRQALPKNLRIVRLDYLDSVGLCTSLANKLLLRQAYPTPKQIAFWDSLLVPISTILDPLTGFSVGKSLLLVAQKTPIH